MNATSSTARGMVARGRKSIVREYAEVLLLAFLLTVFIRSFVVQAFRIPSGSMENTLLVGDFLFVNKFLYGARVPYTDIQLPAIRAPHRGDIMVFKFPEDQTKDFIKRLIGQPGDTLEIRDKHVWINGRPLDEPYVRFMNERIRPRSWEEPNIQPAHAGNKDNFGPVVVPPGHYFMMGDNRDNSADSRYWGFLDGKLIKGRAILIYWSWNPDQKLAGFFPTPRLNRIGRIIR